MRPDFDRLKFLEDVTRMGGSGEMADRAEWITSFFAEMAARGVITMDLGLRLTLLAATSLHEREGSKS